MKRKINAVIGLSFCWNRPSNCPTQKVTGVVISEEDGQPVIGASVLVKGTQVGAITGVDGEFYITKRTKFRENSGDFLYWYADPRSGNKPSLKVVMKSDTEMLDEVMVVAFGTAKKSAFTGSAKVVGTEKLEQSQVTNVTDAWQVLCRV